MTPIQELGKQAKQYLETLKLSGLDLIYKSPQPIDVGQGTSAFDISAHVISTKNALISMQTTVVQCTKCSELASTRNQVVFGSGNANAKLVFVGEAPGYEEDRQGLPFVGTAGQLLTKIIESIGLSRDEVFICNVLKCRPPGNRNPLPNEIANCKPYLFQQLDLIRPQIICALGTFAAQTLLETVEPISSLRGRFFDFRGSKLLCTFHPAYLLRNPQDKRKVWEDMKLIRAALTT